MSITRKPQTPVSGDELPKVDIDYLISKGGSVAAEVTKAKAAQHPLKFPADGALFSRMETVRKSGTVQLPRNTWILQAIAEKLERETQ